MNNDQHCIDVALGERSYTVILSHQGFKGLGHALTAVTDRKRVLLLTEDVVGPIWAPSVLAELSSTGFDAELITLPSGEANKAIETWALAVDAILRAGVDRGTPILGLVLPLAWGCSVILSDSLRLHVYEGCLLYNSQRRFSRW